MKDYIAMFHTHLAALMTSRNLTALEAMDEDVEGVYELGEGDTYVQLIHNE